MIDCGCDEILLPQGSNGVNGRNAFTQTTAAFVQPAVFGTVQINVSDADQFTNQWAIPGQVVRITDGAGNGGWYSVISISGTTLITIQNLGYSIGTSAPSTNILSGATVSPAGLQGPQGNPGGPGAQGAAGPSNILSVDTVTTLAPGSNAFVTISPGGIGAQKLDFGIPRGDSGSTLQYQYSSNAVINLSAGGPYTDIVPQQNMDSTGQLCPTNGDAFRVTFFALFKANGGGTDVNINVELESGTGTNQIIQYSSGDATYNQMVNMRRIEVYNPGLFSSPSSPETAIKFEMIVQRIASSGARVYLSWMAQGPKGGTKSGSFEYDTSYVFNTTDIKKIAVKAQADTSAPAIVRRPTLLVEKLNQ
jgi:hypothetical protein